MVDGNLYVNMEWGAKKFQLKDGLAWLAHWTKKFPGLQMDWSCIEDVNPPVFLKANMYFI